MPEIKQLPTKYQWLSNEGAPRMLVEGLKHYGTLEHVGHGSNPNIIAWSKELGVSGWYKDDDIPWCFAAGTLIETDKRLMPIEQLKTGDLVISHDGKFHSLEQVLTRQKETFKLKAFGILDTITTEDHPYLVRKRLPEKRIDGKRIKHYSLNPEWVAVKNIERGDFIAIPLNTPNVESEYVSVHTAFLIGLYLAEGTGRNSVKGNVVNGVTPRSASLSLNVGKHETERVRSDIKNAGIKKVSYVERRTCMQIEIRDAWFVKMCQKFGRIAIEKHIPTEVYSWPSEKRESLLLGYLSGDGCYTATIKRTDTNTISKPLALSVAKLARSLNKIPTIRTEYRAGKHVIEGREVNVKDRHIVQWFDNEHRPVWFKEDGYLWVPVRSIVSTGNVETVYDLTVKDSHSFLANGAVVHNCGLFEGILAQRSGYNVPANSLRALSWATFGRGIDKGAAMLWDILVFKRPGGGHVGNYIGENNEAYLCYGGNQANAVGFAFIKKDRLYAVRRPIWKVAQPANIRKIILTETGDISNNEQ